jgi:hypothetical protein
MNDRATPAYLVEFAPTNTFRIYLSGSIEAAKQVLREECMRDPVCVTIDPTTFIYRGGEEAGYVVGLLNYPRFPKEPEALRDRAIAIAETLLARTFQRSALVVGLGVTAWIAIPEKDV